ncbi:MAG: magnesium transporter, partial [Myxococcota bacterium]
AGLFQRYDLVSLPVVNDQRKLLGRITIDDIIDVMKEEASEDILQLAGAGGEDLASDRILRSAFLRLPWLITNLFGGLLTGYFMWYFRATLDQIIALITFIPVITGMGGNVGTQSASVTVRGFALGRIERSNINRFLFKEVRVGLLMGIVCGFGLTCVSWIWHGNVFLGMLVGFSLFSAMTVASSMGTLIPAIFEQMDIDPALASGPFVTTLNDVTGILIYLSIATTFLQWLR